jgi:DNA-binding NtrC family response regulator
MSTVNRGASGAAILLFDADAAGRSGLRVELMQRGFEVLEAASSTTLTNDVARHRPDLVIAAPRRGEERQIFTVVAALCQYPRVGVALIVHGGDEALAIAALRAGVRDYLKRPIAIDDVVESVHRCLGQAKDGRPPRSEDINRSRLRQFVGRSPQMCEVLADIAAIAANDANVLITGETGTGKEITAQLIHQHSARAARPMVSINSAAIPDTLLESELFGYERGAFTGAMAAKEGQLETADGGTVFLDEIGDMGPYAQAKILRAIEMKEIYRLGGRHPIPVDIRVVAATNQDLEHSIGAGGFRKDLYYRLNVARIHLPPLRERREDIPLLFDYYVSELNRRYGRHVEGLNADLLDYLFEYDWPGNVRELKNLVEAIFLNVRTPRIGWDDLPGPLRRRFGAPTETTAERQRLLSALSAANWNKSKAAQRLNWSRMTLYRKIAKYDVVRSHQRVATKHGHPPDE